MKKVLSLFLVIIMVVTLAACSKDEKTPVENPTQGETPEVPTDGEQEVDEFFKVSGDINKEVSFTSSGKNAIIGIINLFNNPNDQIESLPKDVEKVFEYARISDEKLLKILEVFKKHKSLISDLNEDNYEFKKSDLKNIINDLKEVLNIIGSDALGLYAYNSAYDGNYEYTPSIKIDVYIIESRLTMKIVNDVLDSLNDEDINTIYNGMIEGNFDTLSLINLVKKAIKCLDFDEAFWDKYCSIVLPAMKLELQSSEFKLYIYEILAEFANDEIYEAVDNIFSTILNTTIKLIDLTVSLIPFGIDYIYNVLDGFNEEIIIALGWDSPQYVDKQSYYDENLGEYVTQYIYYKDGKEIILSKEEYEIDQFNKMKIFINVLYNAYKKLSDETKKEFINNIEKSLKETELLVENIFKSQFPNEDLNEYKYQGEVATIDDVFKEIDQFLLCNTFEEAANGEFIYQALIKYVASSAPLFVGLMMGGYPSPDVDGSIKIGAVGPLAGVASVYGIAVQKGIELAIEEINDSGGVTVNGTKYPFELVDFINDDFDPTKASAALNILASRGADVIIGAVTSGATEGLISEAVKVGIPVITPTGTADSLTAGEDGKQRANRENIFRACFYDSYQGEYMAKYAKEQGYEKVYILYNNDDAYSTSLKDAFTITAEGLGVEIKSAGYSGATNVFDTYWATIKAEGYSCVYVPDYYDNVYSILKYANESGYEGVVYGGDGWDGITTQFEEDFDISIMERCYYTNHFFSGGESETVKKFVASYKAKYEGEVPMSFAALGYDAVYIVKQAIEAADSVEYDAVVKALAETIFTGLVTSSEPFKFDKGNPMKEAFILTFKDGKEVEAK